MDTQWGEVPVATGPLCCRRGEGVESRPAHRANRSSRPQASAPLSPSPVRLRVEASQDLRNLSLRTMVD